MQYNKLVEMDVSQLMNLALGGGEQKEGPIQPDSNIGQFGNVQKNEIRICRDEGGAVKINAGGICVKIEPVVLEALKQFISSEDSNEDPNADITNDEDDDDEDEGEE